MRDSLTEMQRLAVIPAEVQYAIDRQLELAEPLSAASHTTSELNQAHVAARVRSRSARPV